MGVLSSFIAGANAQYRAAGLDQYQMKVHKDGSVTVPSRPAPEFKQPSSAGTAAAGQAADGAAQASSSASSGAAAPASGSAAPAPASSAPVKRAGAAPKISGLQQGGEDAFKLTWAPVAGAVQYGIYQDGVLIGHVTDPSFAAKLANGASGSIQIDAVLKSGTHTALTQALTVARGADGKLQFGAAKTAGATSSAAAAAPAG